MGKVPTQAVAKAITKAMAKATAKAMEKDMGKPITTGTMHTHHKTKDMGKAMDTTAKAKDTTAREAKEEEEEEEKQYSTGNATIAAT